MPRGKRLAEPEDRGVLIAQVSDTHITRDGRQAADLTATLDWLGTLTPRPAVLLLSGDTVNTGSVEQYARLRDILTRSTIPVYAVPGNHDRRSTFVASLPAAYFPGAGGRAVSFTVDDRPVRIIGLDSTAPGRPGGILDAADLAWLDATLQTAPQRPTLVFMHHPPFRTGVNLADMFGFAGLHDFRILLGRYPNVLRVIAGHVHCVRETTIAGALVSTALSSTPQRVPELFERRVVGLRSEPAGFAIHAWDGHAFATTTYARIGGGFIALPAS